MSSGRTRSDDHGPLILLAMAFLVAMTLGVAGCQESQPVADSAEHPGPPTEPAAADLSTPDSAVSSYLDWVGHAYRTVDSDVASHTMTPWEYVRVDSYIELNRQQDRAIDQELLTLEAPAASVEGTGAVLVAYEEWRYRYITMSTGYYDGPWYEVSYDATYSLVLEGDAWLVDEVEAMPLSELE